MNDGERLSRPASIAFKPWYWQRPSRVMLRARSSSSMEADGTRACRLPWGIDIQCYPDLIGLGIERTGVFELVVTESIMRLVVSGETVLDVGANIGYMSAVSAIATGPRGQVHAFEPHPLIADVLRRNASGLAGECDLAPITVHELALSDDEGAAELIVPPDFAANHGTSCLGAHASGDGSTALTVKVKRLENVVMTAALLKLDVEGHELSVLRGAPRLFEEGGIRDVIYEDNDPATTAWLRDRRYEIFGLSQGTLRPLLVAEDKVQRHWDARILLATREPERTRALLAPLFWRSLRRKPRSRPPRLS